MYALPSQKPDVQAIKKDLRKMTDEQEGNVNDYTVKKSTIEETNQRLRSKIGDLLRTGTPIITPAGKVVTSIDSTIGSSEDEARYLIGIAKAALKKS